MTRWLDEHREEILSLAARHGARKVRVFGSMARGDAREDSDVDLLVEFEAGRSLFDQAGLLLDLRENLHREFDIVTEQSLHWFIRDKILQEAKPL